MAAPKKNGKKGKKGASSKTSQVTDARFAAIRILQRVLGQGESLSSALPLEVAKVDERDRAIVQALVYGVLRWRWQIEAILKKFLQKPLKAKDLDVQVILMLGAFQLLWMSTPDYAAVDAAVKNSTKIKKKWATGLVNAVLRSVIRSRDALEFDDDVARYSHPQWLIERIKSDWPGQWQQVLEQANQPAPMTIRVDTRNVSLDDYLKQLEAAELSASQCEAAPSALVLEHACSVHRLPGFDEGLVSVQDAAAQLAADLLDLEPGQRVLDACAAPGGKTAHILQKEPSVTVDAVDISEQRLERVEENLERLGVEANLIAADIAQVNEWWDKEPYDRILLDAPCSATGVIRRHPDIKSLRRASDIEELAETQHKIMQSAWSMLKPGGLMLYATCSILKKENEQQVLQFVKENSDAEEIVIDVAWGHAQKAGRQILTGENQMDGFYYALLRKAD